MTINFKDFEKLDTVAAIKSAPQANFLLTDLNLFQNSNSLNPVAQVNDLVEKAVDELKQVSRYGTDTNSISMSKPVLRSQEIPTVHTSADVKPADWQGLVSAQNPDIGASITEVIAQKAIRMRDAKLEYVEKALAKALFEQKADASKTDDGDLDFNSIMGVTPLDFELDAAIGSSIYQQFGRMKRQLVAQYGAARSYVDRFYMFCSPELYDAIAGHVEVTSLITSKVAEAARGALIADNTSGYDSFTIGSTTFVLADDDRYTIAANSGLIVPKFGAASADVNAFKTITGPCSRNQTIATKGAVSDLYQWINTDKNGMIEINQEFSMIPLVLRPNYMMNVTIA
ncbi:major capsid protein [Pantoea cypripedii]|uniref:Major capsid protein E n=1 Tax=Pantoea cypripedii TaxID=55209 RepID=A0A6B9G3G5_PANCY|nr:major capsid protein [Pantoea cypripedii]QGY29370.1 major capsid protein E [Pantoea cypripedii]